MMGGMKSNEIFSQFAEKTLEPFGSDSHARLKTYEPSIITGLDPHLLGCRYQPVEHTQNTWHICTIYEPSIIITSFYMDRTVLGSQNVYCRQGGRK